MKNVEILSPAGSMAAMKAAFRAGADAVYIGGPAFGARAYAENPDTEDLLRAIDYAHIHHRRLYLTVNTLVKNDEIAEDLIDYMLPYYREGLDAVLVQDQGVLRLFHENFPDLPLHASTQMTVCGSSYGNWLKERGVSRLVLPRELSLDEIRTICRETGMDIEVFIHGALCYCYSGQCLMSSMIGARSGNRGRCAQPCRLRYQYDSDSVSGFGYLLSPKDLCGLESVPDLLDCGVMSLKIEGRMKSPEYAALTTSIYRKYVDRYLEHGRKGYKIDQSDRKALLTIFSRGEFTQGYFSAHNGPQMMSIKAPGHSGVRAGTARPLSKGRIEIRFSDKMAEGDIIRLPDDTTYRIASDLSAGARLVLPCRLKERSEPLPVMRLHSQELIRSVDSRFLDSGNLSDKAEGKARFKLGMPALLAVTCGQISAGAQGPAPSAAVKRPLTREEIAKRLTKSGGTQFALESVDIEMDPDIFMPVSAINELRREALGRLEENILSGFRREWAGAAEETKEPVFANILKRKEKQAAAGELLPNYTALVSDRDQLAAVLDFSEIRIIYIEDTEFDEASAREAVELAHRARRQLWPAMPYIVRRADRDMVADRIHFYEETGADGFLFRNPETLFLARQEGCRLPAAADYGIYCMNDMAADVWLEYFDRLTISPELNRRELAHMDCLGACELVIYGRQPLMISAQCLEKTCGRCTRRSGIHVLTDRKRKEFPVRNVCSMCYNVIYNSAVLMLDMAASQERAAYFRLHFTDEDRKKTESVLSALLRGGSLALEEGTFTRGHYNRGVE